jgi:alpha-beta hydrolase superfamily lysophospholipase
MTGHPTPYLGNWIHSFPDHYQWSNATLVCKGMAPTGSVALGEIDQVVQKLHARITEPQAWWEEWGAMGERIEGYAKTAVAEKRDATAGNYYLRAGNYYYTGERMIEPGAEKTAMYKKALHCFHEGLKRRYSNIEFVDVAYEGGVPMAAYFLKSPVAKGPAPTVVMFDGLDNCKEMSVLFGGMEMAFRGYHVLAIDGPGQGESLRLRNLPSRYDYEVPAGAAYDYVAGRADVAEDRVALMAYSAGGYYAPRAVAFEKRYKGVVAWGGHYDYHAAWVERWKKIKASPNAAATSHFQLPWVLGTPDMESAMEKVKKFTLEGVADKITCPILIAHGASDLLTPPSIAKQLYDNVGSKDKELKIFSAEEGGDHHVQVDNRQVGIDYICDWLAPRL